MELKSTNQFENCLNLSSYLKDGRLSLLNEKFFIHAVDTSQDLYCRLALSYINYSETTLLELSKVLKYAIEKRHDEISKAIAWRLTWVYFTKHKSVLPALVDIWPAYRCTCTDESEYINDFCSSDAVIVVQLDTDEVQPLDNFFSIQVIYFTNMIDKNLSLAKQALPCTDDTTISSSSAETLFDNHQNLTLICKSSFLMSQKQYKPSDKKFEIKSCVNLFCKAKGLIQIGEKHFPKQFCGLPTKIFQGEPTLLTGIQIGSSIGTDDFKKGTLGGFVKFRGEDAFLTCCHVFLKAEDLTSDDITLDDGESFLVKCYSNIHTASSNSTGSSFVCGKIQDFGFERHSDGTSIDAALIRLKEGITIDSKHFVAVTGEIAFG